MDKLTKQELEEMWHLYYLDANGDHVNVSAAEMCFSITAFYRQKYGVAATNDWVIRRL